MSKFLHKEVFYKRFLIKRLRFIFFNSELTICYVSIGFAEPALQIINKILDEYKTIFSFNKLILKSFYFFSYSFFSYEEFFLMWRGSIGIFTSLGNMSFYTLIEFLKYLFLLDTELNVWGEVGAMDGILDRQKDSKDKGVIEVANEARPFVVLQGVKYLLFFFSKNYCDFLCKFFLRDVFSNLLNYGFVFFVVFVYRVLFFVFDYYGYSKSVD